MNCIFNTNGGDNLAGRARRFLDYPCENITQRHRGHRVARAWRASGIIYGMEKSRRGAEGAEEFFSGRGKFSHGGHGETEGLAEARGLDKMNSSHEAQRAQRGSRMAREVD